MNKAFTANINDQVTARGYLDENDQLIMLEPEMSGGGANEFNVDVTVRNYMVTFDITYQELIEKFNAGVLVTFALPPDAVSDLVLKNVKAGFVCVSYVEETGECAFAINVLEPAISDDISMYSYRDYHHSVSNLNENVQIDTGA